MSSLRQIIASRVGCAVLSRTDRAPAPAKRTRQVTENKENAAAREELFSEEPELVLPQPENTRLPMRTSLRKKGDTCPVAASLSPLRRLI